MPCAVAAATCPPGPLLHSSWGGGVAWDRAKWPLRRVEELPAPLLVQLSRLDCERIGGGAKTVADAVRRLGAAGALAAPLVSFLLAIDEEEARRRNARHTGAPPTKLKQVARVLLAAFADPASGLSFVAAKGRLDKSLCYSLEVLLKHAGVERPNRSTIRRAIKALDNGKFGGPPPPK